MKRKCDIQYIFTKILKLLFSRYCSRNGERILQTNHEIYDFRGNLYAAQIFREKRKNYRTAMHKSSFHPKFFRKTEYIRENKDNFKPMQ